MNNAQTRNNARTLNGLNLTQLGDTVQKIQKQPELAKFRFRAKNRWMDGTRNRTWIDGYYGTSREIDRQDPFELDADEPPVLLGKDKAANPAEYLLTALSSCMTTSMVAHAAAQGIEIEAVESEYEGDLDVKGFLEIDPRVRKGYQEIRVKFKVKSDADREKLEELARKSPILDVISNPTPVKLEVVTE